MPHQQLILDTAYEYDDDGFVYDEVDTSIGRQTGKTTLTVARKVHRLTVMSKTHGPQRSMYTAQTRMKARERLDKVFAEALRRSRSFREVENQRVRPKATTEWRLSLNNGSETIQIGRGNYLQVDAPSRTGGHGDTLDDADIDEAFAHQDDTVELGIRPTQATRRDAQLWVSSAAGDNKSFYWYRKVLAGRSAVDSGAASRVAFFEWGADDDADPGDPATWWAACPALGITIRQEFMEAEWDRAVRGGAETINTFRRAYLNQWPDPPVLDEQGSGVIPADAWLACVSNVLPQSPSGWAVDVSPDGASSAIGCSDGLHIELTDHGRGTSWVVPKLVELAGRHGFREVALDASGPVKQLTAAIEEAGMTVLPVNGSEHSEACESLLTAVVDGTVTHPARGPLDAAVRGAARRPLGDSWAWSRKNSAVDICPLVAVTLARWAAGQAGGPPLVGWR